VSQIGFLNRTAAIHQRSEKALMTSRSLMIWSFVAWLATGSFCYATDSIETAGDILQLVLPATAAGLTLGYRDPQGALEFGASAGVTLGVTYGLKYTVNETRPNGSPHSFPSAHTSISFSAAEFMRKRYGWEYGIPAYAAASFVAFSRVESNEHHPRDVIAGAGIGIASSFIFTKPYKGWHVQLDAGKGYHGIKLSRDF
jgi:membrane-associated phospholipid phosphatase